MPNRNFLVLALTLVCCSAFAQTPPTYAAKFVCGRAGAQQVNGFAAAPGSYFTSINVHNPQQTLQANIQKRFTVALQKQEIGPITPFFNKVLPAGRAMQIDCSDIYSHLNAPVGSFSEGFVEIRSSVELDVVSVFTTLGSSTGGVAIHTERVPVRH